MLAYIKKIQNNDLTVRDVEASVFGRDVSRETRSSVGTAGHFKQLAKDLSGKLGVKVLLKGSEDKGKFTVAFRSRGEYDALLALLNVSLDV
jgi:hypothetical protein